MKTTNIRARFSVATSKTEGRKVVVIHSDYKSDAQEAIKLAKTWLKQSGPPA